MESASIVGFPPAKGTRKSFPSAKYARVLPSGEKKTPSTASVPVSWWGSPNGCSMTQMVRVPMAFTRT